MTHVREDFQDILDECGKLNIPIKKVDKHALNVMTDNGSHQGIVMETSPLDFEVVEKMPKNKATNIVSPPLYIALDKITDPMNVGSIIRTASFFNISGVLMETQECAPLNPVVSKASSGALEIYPNILKTKNLMKLIENSKEDNYYIVGN